MNVASRQSVLWCLCVQYLRVYLCAPECAFACAVLFCLFISTTASLHSCLVVTHLTSPFFSLSLLLIGTNYYNLLASLPSNNHNENHNRQQ